MAAPQDDKMKARALEIAISQLEKQFGRGTLVRLGDDSMRDKVQVVSTGSISLDIATGIGGLPRGRVVEIFGQESSGKTTLALHVAANAQKAEGHRLLHRRRTRAGSHFRPENRRGYRQPAGVSAGYRRTGPGNLREPGGRGAGQRPETAGFRWTRSGANSARGGHGYGGLTP